MRLLVFSPGIRPVVYSFHGEACGNLWVLSNNYIFRELAVSYLGRNDLAHVEPKDLYPDTIGSGSDEGDFHGNPAVETMKAVKKMASRGYMRNLLVIDGKPDTTVTSQKMHATQSLSPNEPKTANLVSNNRLATRGSNVIGDNLKYDSAKEARMKGFEGDPCGECGNFTLVRNGTCLKCNTCGATSGCS